MKQLLDEIFNLIKQRNDLVMSDVTFIDEFYKLTKEISVVISNDYAKYEKIIDVNKSYKVTTHSVSMRYIEDPNLLTIEELDELKNQSVVAALPGSAILQILGKAPMLISNTINIMWEKVKTCDATTVKPVIDEYVLRTCIIIRTVYEMESAVFNEMPINESANEEDVDSYMSSLTNVINNIRDYYEKSDYSKIMTPRKKTIDKMKEYVKGALERKYELKIPLYRIEDVTEHTKSLIDKTIIPDLKNIVKTYPEYEIVAPHWSEDQDIYIYLTLKEPFGDKDDKTDRGIDSLKESADVLTKKDRDKLPDNQFGIPELRKFPLNDETHIKQAIRFFHTAKPKYKKILANNISNRVKELNLVGKIYISDKNPFKKYFPDFMQKGYNISKKSVDKKTSKSPSITESIVDGYNRLY